MTNQKYYDNAVQILKNIQYITLATVTPEGDPWNSPLAFLHDKDLNIYWFSDKKNQHSVNVRAKEKAYIVIYDSTAPWGTGEGIYMEVFVKELTNLDEIATAMALGDKQGKSKPTDFTNDGIRRVYKATPTNVWMNDAEIKNDEFIRDYKVELDIQKLKKEISV